MGGLGGDGGSFSARIKENISSDNKEDQRADKVTGKEGGGPAGGLTERIPSVCGCVVECFCFFLFFSFQGFDFQPLLRGEKHNILL